MRSSESPRGDIESLINSVFIVTLVAMDERSEWSELGASVLLACSNKPEESHDLLSGAVISQVCLQFLQSRGVIFYKF